MNPLFSKELKGLRMITNLHCNHDCAFCYQKNKEAKVLDLNVLLDEMHPVPFQHFDYCTIMGGESTLLDNLTDYIKIGSIYAKEVRLTTNGSNLRPSRVQEYLRAGLSGINVSIASVEHYNDLHGTDCDVDQLLDAVEYMVDNHISVRVNIPLCAENMERDHAELKMMLDMLSDMNAGVTMCEDILGSYSLFGNFDKIGATVKEVTDYGLVLLDYNGHQIGYYTHRNSSYNDTDLVVTPLGTWINWTGYCEAVGFNTPR